MAGGSCPTHLEKVGNTAYFFNGLVRIIRQLLVAHKLEEILRCSACLADDRDALPRYQHGVQTFERSFGSCRPGCRVFALELLQFGALLLSRLSGLGLSGALLLFLGRRRLRPTPFITLFRVALFRLLSLTQFFLVKLALRRVSQD